jgi:hypothetical protein
MSQNSCDAHNASVKEHYSANNTTNKISHNAHDSFSSGTFNYTHWANFNGSICGCLGAF